MNTAKPLHVLVEAIFVCHVLGKEGRGGGAAGRGGAGWWQGGVVWSVGQGVCVRVGWGRLGEGVHSDKWRISRVKTWNSFFFIPHLVNYFLTFDFD